MEHLQNNSMGSIVSKKVLPRGHRKMGRGSTSPIQPEPLQGKPLSASNPLFPSRLEKRVHGRQAWNLHPQPSGVKEFRASHPSNHDHRTRTPLGIKRRIESS